MLQLIN